MNTAAKAETPDGGEEEEEEVEPVEDGAEENEEEEEAAEETEEGADDVEIPTFTNKLVLKLAGGHGNDMVIFLKSMAGGSNRSQVLLTTSHQCSGTDLTPTQCCNQVILLMVDFVNKIDTEYSSLTKPEKDNIRAVARNYRDEILSQATVDDI